MENTRSTTDLAGVRDAPALDLLPADEQKAFTKYWADAAMLSTKAAAQFRSLLAAEQLEVVRQESIRLNPKHDGVFTPTLEKGVITGLKVDRPENLRNLSPLRGLPLETLFMWNWKGSDLMPLKGMSLKWLNCGGGQQVLDLTPLADLPLDFLCINYSLTSNLKPLQRVPLTTFMCSNTHVSNLTPLRDMRLRHLVLVNCNVSDLASLQGMPLEHLEINGTKVADLSPLRGMPLKHICLTPSRITMGMDVLRDMPSLQTIGVTAEESWPAAEFWARHARGQFDK